MLGRCITAVDGEHGVGVVRLELAEFQALAEAMDRIHVPDCTGPDGIGRAIWQRSMDSSMWNPNWWPGAPLLLLE
ncbi:hypothetical protein GCM10010397_51220 [Streptomyces spinoverrucosus]|nr:hypothetical protein GCM10010397_51220 [Streptomyces spinoverrucosus]